MSTWSKKNGPEAVPSLLIILARHKRVAEILNRRPYPHKTQIRYITQEPYAWAVSGRMLYYR